MKKEITEQDKQRLEEIKQQADSFQELLDELCEEAIKITGDKDPSGFTFDFIFNTRDDVDDFLSQRGIEVVETLPVDIVEEWLNSDYAQGTDFVITEGHKKEMHKYLNTFLSYTKVRGVR